LTVRQTPVRQTPVRQTPVRQTPVRQAVVRQAVVRRTTAAAITGLALCALAACSGSNPPTLATAGSGSSSATVPATGNGPASPATASGANSAAPAAAADAKSPYCAQVPSSMVGSALKLPVGKQVTSVEGPVSVCAYLGRYEVLVRFQVGENASEFTQSRASLVSLHQSVSAVGGLGEQAYLATVGSGQQASNTLAAREGTIAVFVTAPKPLATERSLMTQLLAKL
jgi:hypothetical protein